MEVLAETDGQRRILRVELGDVGGEDFRTGIALAVAVLRRDDRDRDALLLRGEHVQRLHRRPVVDEEQRLPRALDQPVDERPRVPQLAVVEDALKGWRLRPDEEVDLAFERIKPLSVFREPTIHSILDLDEAFVHGVSAKEIVAKNVRGPDAKLGPTNGLHAVSHGNDDVQAVELDRLVGKRNVQKLHIAPFRQFPFRKHIAYVSSDHGSVTLEQIRHLPLGEPHRFVLETDVQPERFIRLVDDDLVLLRRRDFLRFTTIGLLHGGSFLFGGGMGV